MNRSAALHCSDRREGLVQLVASDAVSSPCAGGGPFAAVPCGREMLGFDLLERSNIRLLPERLTFPHSPRSPADRHDRPSCFAILSTDAELSPCNLGSLYSFRKCSFQISLSRYDELPPQGRPLYEFSGRITGDPFSRRGNVEHLLFRASQYSSHT